MKYIAFLRGINVGGKNLVKMSDLQKQFEKIGLSDVKTVIASGNVIFTGSPNKLKALPYQVVTLSYTALKKVVDSAPKSWSGKDLRKYVAFLVNPLTPKSAAKEVKVKENIDRLDVGKNVLYLSTKLEGLSKSSFKDLIKTKIYKQITLRNFNTVEKILKLMEN